MTAMSDWNWVLQAIKPPSLRAAADEASFRQHMAALDWRLIDPIVINSRADLKGVGRWEGKVQPFEHQVRNLITFCRRLPVSLIADDVGLGKTISAGLILSELLARKRLKRVLIICPALLLKQWKDELATKFAIPAVVARSQDFDRALHSVQEGSCVAVLTTYETVSRRFDALSSAGFDMLVLDEAHRLRNLYRGGDSKGAPQYALKLYDALARQVFRFVLMLTATPMQNSLWDMYSLVDCLAVAKKHRNPFGYPNDFSGRYVADRKTARLLNRDTADEFRAELSQFIARTRRKEARLPFPDRIVKTVPVDPSPNEERLLDVVANLIGDLSALQQSSVGVALMSSPQALAAQVASMANSIGLELRSEIARLSAATPIPSKLARLLDLCREAARRRPTDWRVLVFTSRRETQRLIVESLRAERIATGTIAGGAAATNEASIRKFMADPPGDHVLVSTDSGAEGVNLQAANVVVNFDLPWNPMIVEQRIGRVQRLGSKHAEVHVVNLVLKGSIEERVVGRLVSKLAVIAQTIGDVESILESAGLDGDDEEQSSTSFAAMIRRLVVDGLRGRDVESAERQIAANIANAKRTMDENREEMDRKLGDLGTLHDSGPRPPTLERKPPRTSAKEFVLGDFRVRGATVQADPTPEVFRAEFPGGESFPFTFDSDYVERRPHVFGPSVKVYVPGQAHFERLVQNWCENHSGLVRRYSYSDDDVRRPIEARFAAYEGIGVGNLRTVRTERRLKGTATSYVKAAVAHDSYEGNVETVLGDELPSPRPGRAIKPATASSEVRPTDYVAGLDGLVRASIRADGNVEKFCAFYVERLKEEIARAEAGAEGRKQLVDDFLPNVFAEIAAVEGDLLDVVHVEVEIVADGMGPCTATVMVVPAAGELLEAPEVAVCEVSGRTLPTVCLVRCEASSALVFKALTTTCAVTNTTVLATLTETCAISGKVALKSEFATSAVSGARALRTLFVASAESGALMLASEARKCDFTGALLLPSEVEVSEISGREFRRGKRATSAVSGRAGHRSEFVHCQSTRDLVAPDETAKSDSSGKVVRKDLLVPSELDSTLMALPEEFERCSVTGRRVLKRESFASEVSKRVAAKDLLFVSSTGRKGLLDEGVTCEETKRAFLSDEVALCEATQTRVDRKLLGTSALSGKRCLKRCLVASSISGRPALPDEMLPCAESGAPILPEEGAHCEATGAFVARGRLAKSAVSGKLVRSSLLVRSESGSRRLGLAEETVRCEETSRVLLNDETAICDATGKVVHPDVLGVSAVSGRRVLSRLLSASDASGRRALDDELVICAESGRRLLPDEVAVCAASGAKVEKRLLAASEVSGKSVLARLLVPSAVSGRRGLDDEMLTCAETALRLCPDEVGTCSATNTVVDRRLLAESDLSKRRVLKRLLIPCASSGVLGLKDELVPCRLTGERVAPGETEYCAATGARARRDRMVRSAASNRWYLPDCCVFSAASGNPCGKDEAVRCEWSLDFCLPVEVARCPRTGLTVARRDLAPDGVLAALRAAMKRGTIPAKSAADLLKLVLDRKDPAFKGAVAVWESDGRHPSVSLAVFEIHRLLGLSKRWIAVVIDRSAGASRFVGKPVPLILADRGFRFEP